MRRLLGLHEFVHDAIETTTNLVEETHEAAARKPVALLSQVEPLGSAARAVDGARRGIAKLVFESIRATNRRVQAISGVGFSLASQVVDVALEETRAPSVPTQPASAAGAWVDAAESALNGLCGDFLAARANGLSISASLRSNGRDLPLEPSALARALPQARNKVCVFVHGLGCSDSIWRGRDPDSGEPYHFGGELERELAYTPLYLRYNTGLHISENGRALALLLSALRAAYPRPLEQLALVGHSMGGLVARSAAHYGKALEQPWLPALSHVLCIGSPHFGAPLERVGSGLSSLLGAFDSAGTQVPSKVLNARSAGIKDLHSGSLLDDDWQLASPELLQPAPRPAPFLDGVAYGYVAARYQRTESGLGELLGDLLVQLPSASGKHRDAARHLPFHMGHVLDGVSHVGLTRHPDVGRQLVRFLREWPLLGPQDASRAACAPAPAAAVPVGR